MTEFREALGKLMTIESHHFSLLRCWRMSSPHFATLVMLGIVALSGGLVLAFPLAVTVVKVMLNPFGKGFKVTPKGGVSDRFSFNWQLAFPLIAMFLVTAMSLWMNLGTYLLMGTWQPSMPIEVAEQLKGIGLGWVWSAYNLLMLSIALLILVDVPRTSPYEWYDLRRTARIQIGEQTLWGFTTAISEIGAEVTLTQTSHLEMSEVKTLPVQVTLMEEELTFSGRLSRTDLTQEYPIVQFLFEPLNLNQQRGLVELLYCRPGQWKNRCSPGELESLRLLLKILLKPRFLFDRQANVRAIAVAHVD